MKLSSAVLFLAAMSLAGPALAQTASERAACKADFEKYCPGVAPGGGRIVECLSQQMDKLKPDCQKVVKENMPQ